MQINDGDRGTTQFSDLPTALKTVLTRLDDWLQGRPSVPVVDNPVLPGESQAGSWTATQYENFRSKINLYRTWVDQAYAASDAEESQRRWRRVFGDDFGAVTVRKAIATVESHDDAQRAPPDDVDVAAARGLSALAPSVLRPAWRQPPYWAIDVVAARVTILAKIGNDSGGMMAIQSGMSLEPHQPIFFYSILGGVIPPAGCATQWRITNTGRAAMADGGLRGRFEPSDSPHKRREWLKYRGVHLVEAFIIREADKRLVGNSEPFYVVIE
jgi:hypothetical protein